MVGGITVPLRCPRPRNLRPSHLPRQRGLCGHDEVRAPRGMPPGAACWAGWHHPKRVSLQGQEGRVRESGRCWCWLGEEDAMSPGMQAALQPEEAGEGFRPGALTGTQPYRPRDKASDLRPERASLGAKPGRRPHLPPRMQRQGQSQGYGQGQVSGGRALGGARSWPHPSHPTPCAGPGCSCLPVTGQAWGCALWLPKSRGLLCPLRGVLTARPVLPPAAWPLRDWTTASCERGRSR